jgi:hypothetical protein
LAQPINIRLSFSTIALGSSLTVSPLDPDWNREVVVPLRFATMSFLGPNLVSPARNADNVRAVREIQLVLRLLFEGLGQGKCGLERKLRG